MTLKDNHQESHSKAIFALLHRSYIYILVQDLEIYH